MVGEDREETQRPEYALKEIMRRVMDMEEYEWTEEDEAYFNKMVRRAKEIELRNLTGTWAGIGKSRGESDLD